MYYLQSEASFDAAHFLKGYAGKCANLHGHRWRVLAEIGGEALIPAGPETGMLMDFSHIKGALRGLTDGLDHRLLLEKNSLRPETEAALAAEGFDMVTFPFRTTAENLARWFYDRLREQGFPVSGVTVWETPENCARYTGGGEAVWDV